MPLNHTHVGFSNFVLANEIEDQINSKLNLATFCKTDDSLVGVPGDTKKINVYSATNGTQKLAMGAGNTLNIQVTFGTKNYTILMAQNRFPYYDEEAMNDPFIVPTGIGHMSTDMYNSIQNEIFAEFNKATLDVYTGAPTTNFSFDHFVDAVALLNREELEGGEVFAFVHPKDMASIRKTMRDDLKYVESFIRTGYVGTVGGVNLYTKKNATLGTIVLGTREAVTIFNKKGTEVEQKREPNVRLNEIFSRKYYLVALTDATQVIKLIKGVDPTP